MIDLLLDLLLTVLIGLAIYGLGRSVRTSIRLPFWSRAADLACALGFGLGAYTLLLFGLGLLGLFYPLVGWILLIGGVGLTFGLHRQALREDLLAVATTLRQSWDQGGFSRVWLALLAAMILINLSGDLAPPVEGDTVHQYLLTPRLWVEAGRYYQPTHIWAASLPGSMMMLSGWALLLRPSFSLASLVTGLLMSLFFALAVYALGRRFLPSGAALLAVMAVYTMPDAAYLAQSAKVDMGWIFFETLCLAAYFAWMDSEDEGERRRWLILAGLWLGWAAGSKNQTYISIALLGIWLLGHSLIKAGFVKAIQNGLTFGAATLASAFPYYLYNAVVHRNPFYPVFADLFVTLFAATPSPRSELGTEVFYPWTAWGYLQNAWNMSLGHGPAFYLGFIVGPAFLILIPVGFALGNFRDQRAIKRCMIYAFVFSLVWFLVKQAARHFLPGLVLLSLGAGLVLWRLREDTHLARRLTLGFTALAITWNLVSILGVFYWSGVYRVALGLETRQEYLARWHDEVIVSEFPDWETITTLNTTLGPADRVLSNHATSSLYIIPQMVSGNWGDRIAYNEIADPDTLLDALDEHGISYILTYSIDQTLYSATLPLYATAGFIARYTEAIYLGERAQLYRLLPAEER
jgi:4-amino-4-deoxy-L-arabinose transferase-like glycosyltransferase